MQRIPRGASVIAYQLVSKIEFKISFEKMSTSEDLRKRKFVDISHEHDGRNITREYKS